MRNQCWTSTGAFPDTATRAFSPREFGVAGIAVALVAFRPYGLFVLYHLIGQAYARAIRGHTGADSTIIRSLEQRG